MIETVWHSLDTIRDRARQLVAEGWLDRQQPIYTLCPYIPASAWLEVERELELNEFLLRDPIIDLLAQEEWEDE